MEENLQEQEKQDKWKHLRATQFKPGQSGNPAGRPPGPSLKEWSKSYLAGLTDEERKEFMTGIDKKVVWEMAEGKPKQDTESHVTVELPKPLINVRSNNSNREDKSTG